jgi:hypothetical protein
MQAAELSACRQKRPTQELLHADEMHGMKASYEAELADPGIVRPSPAPSYQRSLPEPEFRTLKTTLHTVENFTFSFFVSCAAETFRLRKGFLGAVTVYARHAL